MRDKPKYRAPKRRSMPARPWYGPDKMRAAWMAGNGSSAEDIARTIGGTTAQRVRAMLRQHQLSLIRKCRGEDVLIVAWKDADRRRLNGAADALDREPMELATIILRRVLAGGPKIISKLIDGEDVD